jgi:hypothetical protein
MYLHEEMANSGENTLLSKSLAKKLLDTVLNSFSKVYVIIDGLDECSRVERQEITAYLEFIVESLPRHNMDNIRCLILSQDDGIARKDLSTWSTLKISSQDNRKDIEAYCQLWHSRIQDKFGTEAANRYNIADLVSARAQGKCHRVHCTSLNIYTSTRHFSFRNSCHGEPI